MASRCVSFQLFEELYAGTIDELASAYINGGILFQQTRVTWMGYNCRRLCGTKKLSTRQRRKISSQLGIPRSNFVNNDEEVQSQQGLLRLAIVAQLEAGTYLRPSFETYISQGKHMTSEMCKTKKNIYKSKLPTTGTTPLKPALAKIMSNLCEVKPSSHCLYPFVGSGSLFQNCHSLLYIGIFASSSRLGCFDDCVK